MRLVVATIVGLVCSAAPLFAQARGQVRPPQVDTIPRASYPPPGMCRVWLNGVPANKQPAPTDCATAVKNMPSDGRGRLLYPISDSLGRGRVGGPLPIQPNNRLPVKPPPPVRPPPPLG